MEIRSSAIYATQPLPLKQQIQSLLKESEQYLVEDEILSIVVPDSNLLSGGRVAANVFKTVAGKQYDTVILVSSSHTGPFKKMTICNLNSYVTPLGKVTINEQVSHELCDEDDDIFLDNQGHFFNKGIDVQLPFLQTILGRFDIVPIVMGEESPEYCRELGGAIGEIMFNRKTLVVASVDILAMEPAEMEQLKMLFEANNVNELMHFLNANNISMQGKGPLLVAMIASSLRYGKRFHIMDLTMPAQDSPGFFGAYIGK